MKKHPVVLTVISLILCTCMIVPVFASPRFVITKLCDLTLVFSGDTAHCTLDVETIDANSEITATIKLQKKGLLGIYTTKEKWENVTGTGGLNFYDTYSPVSSGEYRLTADIEVVGTAGSDSISETATAEKS